MMVAGGKFISSANTAQLAVQDISGIDPPNLSNALLGTIQLRLLKPAPPQSNATIASAMEVAVGPGGCHTNNQPLFINIHHSHESFHRYWPTISTLSQTIMKARFKHPSKFSLHLFTEKWWRNEPQG